MNRTHATLDRLLAVALSDLTNPVITNEDIHSRIDAVCRNISNRACARLLMACALAKIEHPEYDIRKPITESRESDAFSGRSYDERYITHFMNVNRLPLNVTSAFLTPAFRNLNRPLTTDIVIIGRPREIYVFTLQLLDDVFRDRITAEQLLTEIIRKLLIIRNENDARMATLMAGLQRDEAIPLSSEQIVSLIEQHLKSKNASRLPVLIVAAAYMAIGDRIGESLLALHPHNAADQQTGSLGDIEISLENDDKVVTAYEMKMKKVTIDDIDRALTKIVSAENKVHNYIFITTDIIDEEVKNYASQIYSQTSGVEIAVLDCIGFLRHFLHFFHRARINYLDTYQRLVLDEPDSSVNQLLKEAFLILRRAAEADEEA